MAFMVNTDGTILADTAADAVALSELLRGRTGPPAPRAEMPSSALQEDDPIPFKVTAKVNVPPVRKLSAVQLPPPKVEGGKRRPPGTGSVYSPDKGRKWSWCIGGKGNRTVKHGFPTREAAEAALDATWPAPFRWCSLPRSSA